MSGDKSSNNSAFLNDLTAKMAAGPPKKPVGLMKKSKVAEEAEERAKEEMQNSKSPQKELSQILVNSIKNSSTSNNAEDDPPSAKDPVTENTK